ncbi:hypothetical protein CQW23_08424 [Capsicum baccatum]|uniref:Uncharacterized protein n=1 Tax=Capsicum baccatum TaxID=33114 RepID=A0A2G2X8W4_CAPBA|nr:hypothetical protein CQW23_08424 [Capsicum baccatum]
MQIESFNLPALESFLDDDYDKEDLAFSYSTLKVSGSGVAGSTFKSFDALSVIPDFLECLVLPNSSSNTSSSFVGSLLGKTFSSQVLNQDDEIFQTSSIIPLSQERQHEKQQKQRPTYVQPSLTQQQHTQIYNHNLVVVASDQQEASHNGPYFLGRFLEALHYYSTIFDSLDATFPGDSSQRAKLERYIFGPEIMNIVLCEGTERVVWHERLEKWRRVMEGKGFKGVALSANAVTQSKILLGLYSCDGYKLTEDNGCLPSLDVNRAMKSTRDSNTS